MIPQRLLRSADRSLSPSGSGNVNKRKAPEDNFAGDEEVFCPCNVGPCILLTSTKPHSQGRHFYRCPKSKVTRTFLQSEDTLDRLCQAQSQLCRKMVSVGSSSGRINHQESNKIRGSSMLGSSRIATQGLIKICRVHRHQNADVD